MQGIGLVGQALGWLQPENVELVKLTKDWLHVQGKGLVARTLDWFKPKHNVLVKLTQDGLQVQGIGLFGQIWIGSSPKILF